MIDSQTRTVISLVRSMARDDESLLRAVISEVRQGFADQGLWLYEERAWPLFEQVLQDVREDPSADLFERFLPLFDSARHIRTRLRQSDDR